MQNFVYNLVSNYFSTLSKTGYVKDRNVESLIVLIFYYHLLYDDYRGYVSSTDYKSIEKALNCLYGTNCLIPYPDYLKMGKLRLGEITELSQRVKALEETEVLKTVEGTTEDSDVVIVDNEDESEE